MSLELFVALCALSVAVWQLNLQRREIKENTEITALIHLAGLIQSKIDYHDKIIEAMKLRNSDFNGHAKRINDDLRPQLAKVNAKLFNAIGRGLHELEISKIRDALKLND